MYRGAVYVLGTATTVLAILAYGALQPRDSDLHITYYEATDTNNNTYHQHAFHSYSKDNERVHDIDCTAEEAGNNAGEAPASGGEYTPVSCRRSQWFTLFGFLFAVFGWIPAMLAVRDTDNGKIMYKLSYLMFLISALSLWFGYEHALAMSDHKSEAGTAPIKDVSIDHTFPIVLLVSVLVSMVFIIGPVARATSNALDAVADKVESVAGNEVKFTSVPAV